MVHLNKFKSFNMLECSAQWEIAGNGARKSLGFYSVGDKISFKVSTIYMSVKFTFLFEWLRGWVREESLGLGQELGGCHNSPGEHAEDLELTGMQRTNGCKKLIGGE